MKLLSIILISLCTISLQAQKAKPKTTVKAKPVVAKTRPVAKAVPKPYKATAADSANIKALVVDMCGCSRQLIDSLHPVLRTYLIDVAKVGETVAKEKMAQSVSKLDEAEKKKFEESAMSFLDSSPAMQKFEKCIAEVELKHQDKMDAPEKSAKEKAFDKILAHYFKTTEGCEEMDLFYGVGNKARN